MKLEYFDDALDEGLLLIYSGSPEEVRQLRDTLQRLLVVGTRIALHDLEFVECVANCEVIASSDPRGRGIRRSTGSGSFVWSMPPSDWEDARDLLEPFCEAPPVSGRTYFQYLHERGGIEVIYSTARAW